VQMNMHGDSLTTYYLGRSKNNLVLRDSLSALKEFSFSLAAAKRSRR